MKERWLPIPGFPGYEVSDLGRVRSFRQNKRHPHLLRGGVSRGYRHVLLRRDGDRMTGFVHRLVALAFIGPRPDNAEVRHLDGIKAHNQLANLVYGTHRDNSLDVAKTTGHHFGTLTHCSKGHAFDEANTYWRKRQGGGRGCRACKRDWARAHAAPTGRRAGAHNATKTHCPKGHPYDEENTLIDPRGHRRCRECSRESRRQWWRKHHAGTAKSSTTVAA